MDDKDRASTAGADISARREEDYCEGRKNEEMLATWPWGGGCYEDVFVVRVAVPPGIDLYMGQSRADREYARQSRAAKESARLPVVQRAM
jgi:hypothetical protein